MAVFPNPNPSSVRSVRVGSLHAPTWWEMHGAQTIESVVLWGLAIAISALVWFTT